MLPLRKFLLQLTFLDFDGFFKNVTGLLRGVDLIFSSATLHCEAPWERMR
jgi:hypothetical protein